MVSSLRQLFRRNKGTKQFKQNINDFNRLKMHSRTLAGLAGKTIFPGAGCLPGVGCRLAIVRPAEPKQRRSKLAAATQLPGQIARYRSSRPRMAVMGSDNIVAGRPSVRKPSQAIIAH